MNDITNHIDLTDNDRIHSSQQPWDFLRNQPHIGTQNKTQQTQENLNTYWILHGHNRIWMDINNNKKNYKSAQSQKLNNSILSDVYVTYRNQEKKLKFFRTE